MIPHARHLPLGRIEVDPQGALAQVRVWAEEAGSESADVYLHCRSGVRSARAYEILEGELGTDSTLRLHDLAGGYEVWVRDTGGDA